MKKKNGVPSDTATVLLLVVVPVLAVLLPIRATRILVVITLLGLASKPVLVAVMEKTKIVKEDPQALN